jgi:hypothetical protein
MRSRSLCHKQNRAGLTHPIPRDMIPIRNIIISQMKPKMKNSQNIHSYILFGCIVWILAGCSSLGSKKEELITTEFVGGALKVSYTSKGEFKSLESIASSQVVADLPNSREQAVSVATAKARRQIAEFIKTEIESERFYQGIASDTQSLSQENTSKDKNISVSIANNVREQIKQKSSVILKGTYVAKESFNETAKVITVVVKSSKEDIGISKSLKRDME